MFPCLLFINFSQKKSTFLTSKRFYINIAGLCVGKCVFFFGRKKAKNEFTPWRKLSWKQFISIWIKPEARSEVLEKKVKLRKKENSSRRINHGKVRNHPEMTRQLKLNCEKDESAKTKLMNFSSLSRSSFFLWVNWNASTISLRDDGELGTVDLIREIWSFLISVRSIFQKNRFARHEAAINNQNKLETSSSAEMCHLQLNWDSISPP